MLLDGKACMRKHVHEMLLSVFRTWLRQGDLEYISSKGGENGFDYKNSVVSGDSTTVIAKCFGC